MISGMLDLGEFGLKKLVLRPFAWRDPVVGLIEVPAGFIFDGASIPRAAWTLLGVTPFDGRIIHAAVIHDWLYSTRQRSRKTSDKIFKRIMKKEKLIGPTKRFLIYHSVRAGGGRAYNKTKQLVDFFRPELVESHIRCNHE